ncbi:MAG: chemotaxis protein CheA [Spirochaetaceae bacterium]|nr:MAG: chemotaxis protein CheA [Spirochaetaceae bacterium]
MDKFKENFREEAYDLLNSLEHSLLELESDPANQEEISAVFRCMHTIKGSAAMFGFQAISDFAHEIETVLELVRDGSLQMDEHLISITLAVRDHIRSLLDAEDDLPEEHDSLSRQIVENLQRYVSERRQPALSHGIVPVAEPDEDQSAFLSGAGQEELDHFVTYRVRFAPKADIYLNGTNPLLLLAELRDMGESTVVPNPAAIPRLSELNPHECLVSWDVILTTRQTLNSVRDVFIFVEDAATVRIDPIDDLSALEDEPHRRLGQILADRGVVDLEVVEQAAGAQKRLGQMLVEQGVDEQDVESALAEQEHVKRSRARIQNELATSSIRVGSEKLDLMVDLVGEIVTLQARLTQTAKQIDNALLSSLAETFERLTDELRDSTMSIRMLPIGSTFSKFRRLVRDLSQELGKKVEMETLGGETELDKTVIDRLNDPLVHLIRNCVDHGIERPEVRGANGKPEQGSIRLTAEHSGASVIITIQDDGSGLDRRRILEKARDRGVVAAGAELSESEIMQLIFSPGFSTAQGVTQVSGRGVGLDVVKKEIEALGGTVTVSSQTGQGTRMALTIPLTLAIIDGLLVEIDDSSFVFPLQAVQECIELTSEMRAEHNGQQMINNRGQTLPYVRLRKVFSIEGELPEIEQVVVVNTAEGAIGFLVDNVVGDLQTVIKSMGRVYHDLEGISGATILGDGSVALILDVGRLIGLVGASHA